MWDGPERTSEDPQDLARQRRARGGVSQADQKAVTLGLGVQSSFLEEKEEVAAEIHLDLLTPKTSQEHSFIHSFHKYLLRT